MGHTMEELALMQLQPPPVNSMSEGLLRPSADWLGMTHLAREDYCQILLLGVIHLQPALEARDSILQQHTTHPACQQGLAM